MAKKTRTELSTLALNTNLPNNTTELITPTTERAQLTDERESVVNYKDDFGGATNAGKFLTVATDGESLTMVDDPGGDVSISGTPVAAQIAIWTDASTIKGDALLVLDTTFSKLKIVGTSAPGIVINAISPLSAGGGAILFEDEGTTRGQIYYTHLTDLMQFISSGEIKLTAATGIIIDGTLKAPEGESFTFATQETGQSATTAFTIDSTKNATFNGTLAATGAATFNGTLAATGAATFTSSAGITNGNGINLRAGGNTASDGNVLNFTSFGGTINTSIFSDALNSNTRFKSNGTLSFHTGDIGITATNERLTISSTGSVNVGGSFSLVPSSASTTVRIQPNTDSDAYMGLSSNRWIAVYAVNGSIQTSDIREKTEIKTIKLGLDFINDLNPISYKWKNCKRLQGEESIKDERNYQGLIAQEFAETLEKHGINKNEFGGLEIQKTEKYDDFHGMTYSQLIAPMIKAIQEQQTIIDSLITRLEALEA